MLKRFWLLFAFALLLPAQQAQLRNAPPMYLPSQVDSNSPAYWTPDGRLNVLSSFGITFRASGPSQMELEDLDWVEVTSPHVPAWIEAVWQEPETGRLFAWYHHEIPGTCPGSTLAVPKIGALISEDGGATFTDLGIILEAGAAPNCDAKNGFFAGGHGDFSVILDPAGEYFYFLFTNYAGPADQQGVALARLPFAERFSPAGHVQKFHAGDWSEPGLGGAVTPVLAARTPWESDKADSFWGPSVHFNTATQRHVVLLNRACCAPRWPQEGIYLAFIEDLANPESWSTPRKILDPEDIDQDPAFYPQVLGIQFGETDTLASRVARLYVQGVSKWELVFTP